MAFNHAARAKQVAAVLDHSGTALAFTAPGETKLTVAATIVAAAPDPEAHDNDPTDDVRVVITAPRAAFTGTFPRAGQYLTHEATGRKYRIGRPLSHAGAVVAIWEAVEI